MNPHSLDGITTVHLLGIGGIGVSALAKILLVKGYSVSGSDVRESCLTRSIAKKGAQVVIGHRPENVHNKDLVVFSTAIPKTNIELLEAQKQKIPTIHRAALLWELMKEYQTIGITGTHGKGTVSAMITWIMDQAGYQPGFMIGGILENYGTNAKSGGGKWMIAEVDESDGSLQGLKPNYVVCNFLELDHLNYYNDLDHIIDSMVEFLNTNNQVQEAFINVDDSGNRRMMERVTHPVITYGFSEQAQYRGNLLGHDQLPLKFEVTLGGEFLGRAEIPLPGHYNVLNALAAISVTHRLGVNFDTIARALRTFKGLENRFTIVKAGDVTLVKDYNSHPTCISKVLKSSRRLIPGRLFSVFKPYRYTLIKYLQNEYATCFAGSDDIVLTKMYAAEEDPIPGIDTHFFVNKIRAAGHHVTYIEDQNQITDYLRKTIRKGDGILFFGGDDFFQMADNFAEELKRN